MDKVIEHIKQQAEELPEEMNDKEVEIDKYRKKVSDICHILQRDVLREDDADFLYFLHLAIKMMPKAYRDKLYYEVGLLLGARRNELLGRREILEAERKRDQKI